MTISDYPKKKLIVADILRLANEWDTFVIRDVTPALHAPGPDGDGIIYRGHQEDLLWNNEGVMDPICIMVVEHISPYQGDCESGYSLSVTKANIQCQCRHCGSTFISGDSGDMLTCMCIRCGYPMEVIK